MIGKQGNNFSFFLQEEFIHWQKNKFSLVLFILFLKLPFSILTDATEYVKYKYQFLGSRSGGTGRHAVLRGQWRDPWGFESPLRHHTYFCHN